MLSTIASQDGFRIFIVGFIKKLNGVFKFPGPTQKPFVTLQKQLATLQKCIANANGAISPKYLLHNYYNRFLYIMDEKYPEIISAYWDFPFLALSLLGNEYLTLSWKMQNV